jgi:hypothetical protein
MALQDLVQAEVDDGINMNIMFERDCQKRGVGVQRGSSRLARKRYLGMLISPQAWLAWSP